MPFVICDVDDVLLEIFVLIISPNKNEIRIEGVYFLPNPPKGFEDTGPVSLMRGHALIIAPFLPHGFGPVGRILHMFRNPVTFKHSR